MRICSIEGCGGKHQALGFCTKHYLRHWSGKNPMIDPRPEVPAEKRFHTKYSIDEKGCWIWNAQSTKFRACTFWFRKERMTAYRASYIMHKGEIPEGLVVRHKCDVPACVNPEHLELGTQVENCADKVLRGRCNVRFGSTHTNTSLTEKDVLEIRASLESRKALALRYGIHYMTITDIIVKKTWKHI